MDTYTPDICVCSSSGFDIMMAFEKPMVLGRCELGLKGNSGIKGGACGVTLDLHGSAPKTAEEGDDWWLSTWEEVIDNVDGKDEPLRNLGYGEPFTMAEVHSIKTVEWDVHGKPINTGLEVGVWGVNDVYSHMSASYSLVCGVELVNQLEYVPFGMAMAFHGVTTGGKPVVMKVGWQYDMRCNSLPMESGNYLISDQIIMVSKGVCFLYMIALLYFV